MKLPIDWLKEFVSVDKSPEEVGDIFTLLGFETESIENGVIDLEVTPNRGDALSIYGLAREYAAATNQTLHEYQIPNLQFGDKLTSFQIENKIPELVTRYSAIIIDISEIKASPPQMQNRLRSVGIRPINNIVDATNYVMVEFGLPLHAFDIDRINGSYFQLRLSREGETLTTLDGVEHKLPEGVIVIEDKRGLVDLVGIMGGENSGITNKTKRILIHCPIIDSKTMRRAIKLLKTTTDAAYRFERTVDWGGATQAVTRVYDLLRKQTNAALNGQMDACFTELDRPTITVSRDEIIKTLGIGISLDQAKKYLERLGCEVKKEQSLLVTPPTWRSADIQFPIDVIEEIARIHGYNIIPKNSLPKIESQPKKNSDFYKIRTLADWLVGLGFQQTATYTFVSKDEIATSGCKLADQRALENPLNPELVYLRTTLVIGQIKTLAKNSWYGPMQLFEIGHVFPDKQEQVVVCLAQTGDLRKQWSKLLPDADARLIRPDHPLAKLLKLRTSITVIEIPLEKAIKWIPESYKGHSEAIARESNTNRPFSRLTPIVRDIAIVAETKVGAVEIKSAIQSVDNLIFLVDLFDEFQSIKLGENKISRAFHVIFDDPKIINNELEINKIWERVVKIIEEKKWKIRV